MTMTKWIAALAAVSLATAPAAAQASRTSTPVGDTEALTRGATIAWIIALIMAVGAVLIISDDDEPASP
jgi:hypothetical protein